MTNIVVQLGRADTDIINFKILVWKFKSVGLFWIALISHRFYIFTVTPTDLVKPYLEKEREQRIQGYLSIFSDLICISHVCDHKFLSNVDFTDIL